MFGAGEGNRTLVSSLEGWRSTIELHPRHNAPHLTGRACLVNSPPCILAPDELPIARTGGRVIDPANRFDAVADVLDHGWKNRRRRREASRPRRPPDVPRLDAHGTGGLPGVDRFARAFARTGTIRQGNHRHRHGVGGARRIYFGGLHAQHFAGHRQRRDRRADSRTGGAGRARSTFLSPAPSRKNIAGRGIGAHRLAQTAPGSSPSPTTAIACRTTI